MTLPCVIDGSIHLLWKTGLFRKQPAVERPAEAMHIGITQYRKDRSNTYRKTL